MTGFPLNLPEAASALGAVLPPDLPVRTLTGISTDSRSTRPGELFFALKGEKFDGHDYLAAALEKGAAAAVVSGPAPGFPGVRLEVPDTLTALGDLAACLRGRFPIPAAAVTGSNGKTTTKEMVVEILQRKRNVLSTKGNFNNLVGLPLTLFGLRPEHQALVLEMGMNRPGEIARLTEIAAPNVGVVVNVGPAHIEGLGSLEGVARAKGELYERLGPRATAAVNLDDPLVRRIAEVHHGPRLTFGFDRRADVRGRGYRLAGFRGAAFDLLTPQGDARVRLRLLGRRNAQNALAAAATALALGASLEDITAGLEASRPFPGRLELKTLPGPVYLINDAYNSNPVSVQAALVVLSRLRGKGRTIAVLGDMLELGVVSGEEHARVGRTAIELGINILAAVGPRSRDVVDAAGGAQPGRTRVVWFQDAEEAAPWLAGEIRPYDRVLVKGSRGMRMERVVRRLAGQGEVAR
ncbi:MAG: UDP-N-acetylmuramoyl-tripeptide--D-alanyl-D-alanine ligase [Pseudomonadota bacterium]